MGGADQRHTITSLQFLDAGCCYSRYVGCIPPFRGCIMCVRRSTGNCSGFQLQLVDGDALCFGSYEDIFRSIPH
eukprot:scaffold116042_cov48-Prasinocladus_malaysianus.AAC.2